MFNQIDEINTYQKLISFYEINKNKFEYDFTDDFKQIKTVNDINDIKEAMQMIL